MLSALEIRNLHVSVEGKEILKGIDLAIRKGETHALMGPNGSGKSTLALAMMGHPSYKVTTGQILIDGKNILDMAPNERAKAGLFLSFQYPSAVPGVSLSNFLRTAINNLREKRPSLMEFKHTLREEMASLRIDKSFADRSLNDGLSGGEKKRSEILQMAMLRPGFAVLDETDSGLDIDSLRIISKGVNRVKGATTGILIITHYQRVLRYIKPDVVHVMINGNIVKSGGAELAEELEANGYRMFQPYEKPVPLS